MSSILEMAATATIAGCIIAGAYQVGKLSERQRWRLDLAAGNAKLERVVHAESVDTVDMDRQLIEGLKDAERERGKAEASLEKRNSAPPPAAPVVAAPGGVCTPVPAHCLRRSGAGGAAPGRVAASGG